jgi:hypothetical protein
MKKCRKFLVFLLFLRKVTLAVNYLAAVPTRQPPSADGTTRTRTDGLSSVLAYQRSHDRAPIEAERVYFSFWLAVDRIFHYER